MSYECHITITVADAPVAIGVLAGVNDNWKTSEIKRDPVLGDGSHFYLTAHDGSLTQMLSRMQYLSARLREQGVEVLREKIEIIIYDTKTGKS